jgi:hypothetical protein
MLRPRPDSCFALIVDKMYTVETKRYTIQELRSTPTLVAASRHNTQATYQVSFVQRLLKMSK